MRGSHPPRWLVAGTCVLAVLLAIASIAGIYEPAIYAKETASWGAQGLGQDLVDLLVIVPVLLGCAFGISRHSRAALLVLAGVLVYVIYSFVLYALAMHFNALFLVYCATLGVAFYSLVDIALYLRLQNGAVWFAPTRARTRTVGWFLISIAAMFYLLWLSSVIPALITGVPPAALAEAGLITNPVHVLDLSIVLPAIAISGFLVLARRPSGMLLAPIMLAFDVAMTLAILGMNFVLWARGLAMEPVVVALMTSVAIASTWMLVGFLRRASSPQRASQTFPTMASAS